MTRGAPLISIVLVCMFSFSMFGCEERDDFAEDNLIPDGHLHFRIHKHLREIKGSLGWDFDAPITAEDMLKLTALDAEGFTIIFSDSSYISNLTGLEYAENLVVLNLNNNAIVDVSPLQGLENLKELNLGNNEIVDVCTAIGNLGHPLNQDCDTIAIQLKGAFRWQNGEDSPPNLRLRW